jgi:hypothetical protein
LKKNIFKKCNFLIIIFFSQIAQPTTLEKFNVTCFPHGWHYKNISFCSIFFKPQRLKWNVACFPRIIFPYFFQTTTFEILCYLFSTYHFPVLVQIAMFEILRYLCDVIKIFPYFFKNKFSFVTESIFYKFYILSIFTTKCTNTTACYSF